MGSGQFGTPCARIHRENLSISVIACRTKAWGQSPANMHCRNESALSVPPLLGEQVLAGCLGRLEAGAADPEPLRADLRERPAGAGVGIARHAVRTDAVGVADR